MKLAVATAMLVATFAGAPWGQTVDRMPSLRVLR